MRFLKTMFLLCPAILIVLGLSISPAIGQDCSSPLSTMGRLNAVMTEMNTCWDAPLTVLPWGEELHTWYTDTPGCATNPTFYLWEMRVLTQHPVLPDIWLSTPFRDDFGIRVYPISPLLGGALQIGQPSGWGPWQAPSPPAVWEALSCSGDYSCIPATP